MKKVFILHHDEDAVLVSNLVTRMVKSGLSEALPIPEGSIEGNIRFMQNRQLSDAFALSRFDVVIALITEHFCFDDGLKKTARDVYLQGRRRRGDAPVENAALLCPVRYINYGGVPGLSLIGCLASAPIGLSAISSLAKPGVGWDKTVSDLMRIT